MTPQEIYEKTMSGVRKRRVLREFRIDEISAVDRPAQQHAKMSIIKRDDNIDAYRSHQSPVKFNEMIDAIAKSDKSRSRLEVMRDLARRYPALRDADRLVPSHRPSYEKIEKRSVTDFRALVDQIAKRDGIEKSAAMSKARREHPAEFAAYQQA